MDYEPSTVFITGQAKPGKEDAISSLYSVFFVSLVVDLETDIVIDATCNTVRGMTETFIRGLLVGRNFATDLNGMVTEIQHRFFGLVQKTLIVALKDAHNRYMMVKKSKICEI